MSRSMMATGSHHEDTREAAMEGEGHPLGVATAMTVIRMRVEQEEEEGGGIHQGAMRAGAAATTTTTPHVRVASPSLVSRSSC
jgi:hypothetical protein